MPAESSGDETTDDDADCDGDGGGPNASRIAADDAGTAPCGGDGGGSGGKHTHKYPALHTRATKTRLTITLLYLSALRINAADR